jgi:hypothetical protein
MTEIEFHELCGKLDWFCDMSDDASVAAAGRAARKRVRAQASELGFEPVFNAWSDYTNSRITGKECPHPDELFGERGAELGQLRSRA